MKLRYCMSEIPTLDASSLVVSLFLCIGGIFLCIGGILNVIEDVQEKVNCYNSPKIGST